MELNNNNIPQLPTFYYSEDSAMPIISNNVDYSYCLNPECTQFQEYWYCPSDSHTDCTPESNINGDSQVYDWEYGKPCPIPDDVILNLDIVSLRKLLASLGVTPLMEAKVKLHRRKLLSRIYSIKSRNKVMQSIKELELIKEALENEKEQLIAEVNQYKSKINQV